MENKVVNSIKKVSKQAKEQDSFDNYYSGNNYQARKPYPNQNQKKKCEFFFKNGYCGYGNNCRFSHDREDYSAPSYQYKNNGQAPYQHKNNVQAKRKNLEYKSKATIVKTTGENCPEFLKNGKCNNTKYCKYFHNFSLLYNDDNKREYVAIYDRFVKILSDKNIKVFFSEKTNLDLMFIIDCTLSMEKWISLVKDKVTIIIKKIKYLFPESKVRISIVGFRDWGSPKHFDIMDFSEEHDKVVKFLEDLKTMNGLDFCEDTQGGLIKGLEQTWKSQAKFAILIEDCPCHGSKYHPFTEAADLYFNVQKYPNTIEDVVATYAERQIVLTAIKITSHTDVMFKILSESYKKVSGFPIEIADLQKAEDELEFYVANRAIDTISQSVSKITFEKMMEELQKCSYSKSALSFNKSSSSKYEFLKQADVYKDIKDLDESFNVNCTNPISGKSGEEILELKVVEKPEPKHWIQMGSENINAQCVTVYIPKEKNNTKVNVNWRNLPLSSEKINTVIRYDKEPFSKGGMRYSLFMYDIKSEKKLVAKIPFDISKRGYNFDKLKNDNLSLTVSSYIADEFNNRIIEIKTDTNLINFVDCHIYKLEQTNLPLFQVENYIPGKYVKYNNNCGWALNTTNETLMAQAFSHFSWQYTRGYLMIVDLQGVGKILTDPQIHCLNRGLFGSGNMGVIGMLMFFLTHCCNSYCKQLNLLNPCNDSSYKVNKDFDFFVDKIQEPENPKQVITKICNICKEVFSIEAGKYYQNRIEGQSCICTVCTTKMSVTENKFCEACEKSFKYSPYWYKMKHADVPGRCKPCKMNRRYKKKKKPEIVEEVFEEDYEEAKYYEKAFSQSDTSKDDFSDMIYGTKIKKNNNNPEVPQKRAPTRAMQKLMNEKEENDKANKKATATQSSKQIHKYEDIFTRALKNNSSTTSASAKQTQSSKSDYDDLMNQSFSSGGYGGYFDDNEDDEDDNNNYGSYDY